MRILRDQARAWPVLTKGNLTGWEGSAGGGKEVQLLTVKGDLALGNSHTVEGSGKAGAAGRHSMPPNRGLSGGPERSGKQHRPGESDSEEFRSLLSKRTQTRPRTC